MIDAVYPTPPACRLIVLQYNRRDLLERFLPSIVAAAERSTYSCKVAVLDNCSRDDSVDYVRKNFPNVEISVTAENKILCSFNDYVAQCPEEIVILLNNDMELAPDFVDPLIEPFLTDKDVFFVSTAEDRSIARLKYGILSADIHYKGHEILNQQSGCTFSAGVAAFNRKMYLELGGYDDLYLPGRYEDVDLCYRGWKNGWKGVYQPLSKKHHLGGASFDQAYNHHATQSMVFRNAILFTVKNITDPWLFFKFLFWLPFRFLGAIVFGKWFFITGFFQSFERLPKAFQKRAQARKFAKRSDQEIIALVNRAYLDLIQSGCRTHA